MSKKLDPTKSSKKVPAKITDMINEKITVVGE
jgi:hypothetical protein